MQSPIIVFDHTAKTVTTIPTGPAADKKLAEALASQVATSGRPSKR
jgi:hypothetical protein